MAPRTPRRSGRLHTESGGQFPSQVLATNVRALRALREMRQEDLGRLMGQLGHNWSGGTVGFVERADRAVDVDELVALALALDATVVQLLDPAGIDGRRRTHMEFGGVAAVVPPEYIGPWLRGTGRPFSLVEVDGQAVLHIGDEPLEAALAKDAAHQEVQQ